MAEDENTAAANQSPVAKAEFNRLLAAMEGVQEQIHTMKRELSTEREAADERLAKKIRLDRGMVFKKKTHEKQFCFNEDVREKISSAANSLDTMPPAVERAKEALKEGERLLVARQKAIRIADRSEFGWATVDEYEEDELAENSDDEKRLYRAEMRAGRKLKAAAAKNRKKKEFIRKEWTPKAQLQTGSPTTMQRCWFSEFPAVLLYSSSGSIPVVHGLGPCFLCGKMGHFRRSCPLVLSQTMPISN